MSKLTGSCLILVFFCACGATTPPSTNVNIGGDSVVGCATLACDANATCISDAVTNAGSCQCNAGYSGPGPTCSDVDECLSNPCATGAICTNTPGAYTCTCRAGEFLSAQGCGKLELGPAYAFVIKANGELWGWGLNSNFVLSGTSGYLEQPTRIGSSTFVSVSSQDYTTCALRTDGKTLCWGYNNLGQAGALGATEDIDSPNEIPGQFQKINSGLTNSCGIKADGTLWCWGSNAQGQLQLGAADALAHPNPVQIGSKTWQAVDVGQESICALDTAGALYCWGGTVEEQVGHSGDRSTVTLVNAGPFSSLSKNRSGTCVLKAGELSCFGYAYNNGQGTTLTQKSLLRVGDKIWTSFRLGSDGGCGQIEAGGWECFGSNNYRNMPGITAVSPLAPQAITGDWQDFKTSGDFACASKKGDGAIVCYGVRTDAQLGNGRAAPATTPRALNDGRRYAKVFAGYNSFCATTDAGAIVCFGPADRHRMGTAEERLAYRPVQIPVSGSFVSVTPNETGMGAVRNDGRVFMWGDGIWVDPISSQLTPLATPTEITSLGAAATKIVAKYQLFGVLNNNAQPSLVFGGTNRNGSLGRNLSASSTYYSAASTGTADTASDYWRDVAVSTRIDATVCAIRQSATSGGLYCWGANGSRQAGKSATADIIDDLNGQIDSANDWAAVATGEDFTCARKTGGAIYCFGNNSAGQLGVVSSSTHVPQLVAGTYKTHAIGTRHTCAIQSDDKLYCWGANRSGALAQPLATQENSTPLKVNDDLWLDVAATNSATCAIKKDSTPGSGTLYCWGDPLSTGHGDVLSEDGVTTLTF